jgi:DNA-binding response OmpR family regulator
MVDKYARTGAVNTMMNSNREKKRILFVEDHEDSWEIVSLNLAECAVVYARNFNEGLRLARRGYFDLYILDNWLPGGSGVELCRAIRDFDPHTPILFYSAAAYAHDIQEGLRAGAQAYLTKPVSFDELTRAVARLTPPSDGRNFEARQAESAAILEELNLRQTKNADRVVKAKEKYLRAEERVIRVKAEIAFLRAGGTRGDFAREWLSGFWEEVQASRRPSERRRDALLDKPSYQIPAMSFG